VPKNGSISELVSNRMDEGSPTFCVYDGQVGGMSAHHEYSGNKVRIEVKFTTVLSHLLYNQLKRKWRECVINNRTKNSTLNTLYEYFMIFVGLLKPLLGLRGSGELLAIHWAGYFRKWSNIIWLRLKHSLPSWKIHWKIHTSKYI